MAINFNFQETHFNKLFPFYILINQQMVVESTGSTMEKLYAGTRYKKFEESFMVKRPRLEALNFDSLKSLQDQLVVIECKDGKNTIMRGQFDFLPDTGQILFLGSPWFDCIEDVIKNNLSLHDFAFHDSMTDLLHTMKTHENTNEDLRYLLSKVNNQKDELKNAYKEIHDIALFPTQNPDPLMRINFEGDLLQNNPAAALLDFIEFENKTYRNDDFFQLIAENIDSTAKRWTIEASSGAVDYSFACIPMIEEGYVNIYGRDITQQRKDQQELEKLSLIIQQTINAVIVTDAYGKIEWVNNSFKNITGYSLPEILGKSPGSFLQGKDTDPSTVRYMSEQINKREPFSCEIYNYRKSGKGYWLRINGQPVFDKAGNVVNFFAIEEDITNEREIQEKLREYDNRLKLALQKIGDNVWEHDFLKEETSFSQQEDSLLGYSFNHFKNNTNLWYTSIHNDDRKIVQDNDVKYRTKKIDHHSLEYRLIHKDGSIKWVLDRGVVIEKTSDGSPLKIIGTHTDITKQKNIEKELEATASRLSSLITNLYSGVLLENESRHIAFVNKTFCEIFSVPVHPLHLVGSDCSQSAEQTKHLFKNPEAFIKRIDKIISDRKLVIADQLELVDGRYLQRDFIPIWNDDKYDGHLWVYTDITEKINADKKLEEQRVFYERILDNIPSDIAVFNNQHEYLYLNQSAIKDPAIRKWIIGKKDEDYVKARNKPLVLLESRRKVFKEAVATKNLTEWEEQFLKANGTAQYMLRRMHPVVNDDGEVNMVIGYGLDITNLKSIQQQISQSEKRYRDLIDHCLAIVTTHDLSGNFLSINPMVEKIYGYKEQEIVGRPLTDFMPEEDRNIFNENYLSRIITEKQVSGILKIVHKNGNIVYSLFNNFLKEEPGMEPYIIGFAVDITDRIKAEKELKIAKKITEELAQTKQNFLANMSHEIRTPMNAIMGMTNQLNKTSLTDSQKFLLNIIHSASDNLLIIINDILDLSKIEAGKLSLEHIGFEPKLVVGRVMQVMMHKAEEKGLALTNSFCDSKLNDVLLGDPYRLNQVLLNLLSNAIKFTEKGSVDIRCKVISDAETEQIMQVTVQDTGIGMDESYVKNLFQKFTQEDESVTRKFGGTGLGMSICKELVELMGGTIDVQSKKGYGTTFSFNIPLSKGTAKDLPVKDTSSADVIILSGKKILVTDDNEMNRLVASTILKSYGADVEEAQNGSEAIDKIKLHEFDIVLMDVQMPIMDGIEATKVIRATISKNLPIIALTAFALKGDNATFINAGMNDYISKPFEENVFLKTISRWLGKLMVTLPKVEINDKKAELYNLTKLYAIAKGKDSFVNKMIELFIEHVPPSVNEISNAYKEKDFEKIKSVAHRLRPSIDNMGIESLKNEIQEIEKLADGNQPSEHLNKLISKMEEVVSQVVIQLKERPKSDS